MAEEFISFVVTSAGEDIISRIIAGLNVTFSTMAIGDGFDYNTEQFVGKTELVNKIKSLEIKSIKITDAKNVELSAEFSKSDIKESFYYRELGIYIVDPDDETKEILFAYGNKNDAAEYITPHVQNYAILKNIKCVVRVGSSAKVNIIYSTNENVTTVDFTSDEWIFDEKRNIFKLELGNVLESLKIFRKVETGKIETGLVTITRDENNCTILEALTAFDGCAVCA